jgi:hypothetical protein
MSLQFEVRWEAGGVWTLSRGRGGWNLFTGSGALAATRVSLDQETAWKLFSKGLSAEQAARDIRIEGDMNLGRPVIGTLAVMA